MCGKLEVHQRHISGKFSYLAIGLSILFAYVTIIVPFFLIQPSTSIDADQQAAQWKLQGFFCTMGIVLSIMLGLFTWLRYKNPIFSIGIFTLYIAFCLAAVLVLFDYHFVHPMRL